MSSQGPQDWLTIALGITSIQVNGVPIAGSPGERTLNLKDAADLLVGVDNPSNGSTDVTIPPGSAAPLPAVVNVVGPATSTATPGAWHYVDVSSGAVTINTPTGAGVVQQTFFRVKIVKGPVSGTNSFTVAGAGGSTVEEPVEQSAPLTGVQGASAIFQIPQDLGEANTWAYDGVSKWWMQ